MKRILVVLVSALAVFWYLNTSGGMQVGPFATYGDCMSFSMETGALGYCTERFTF